MEKYNPPKWALRFFRWFCRPEIVEDIEGDLLESYGRNIELKGLRNARSIFTQQVFLLIRPGIIRSFNLTYPKQNYLFRHNLLMAWRNAKKDRNTFIINLVGLSTALATCFLIWLWVSHQRSFDKNNRLDDQLFQVMHNIPTSEGIYTVETTPGYLAAEMEANIPEISTAVSVVPPSWFDTPGIISLPEKSLKARVQYIDKTFFDVFTCVLTQGEKTQFLENQRAVLVSDHLAIQLFGSVNNVLNKTVSWNDGELSGDFLVSGVFQSLPENVSDPYDLMVHYDLFLEERPSLANWENSDPSTYFILAEGANIDHVTQKINALYRDHITDSDHTLITRKYSDQYLFNRFENGVQAGGRVEYIRLFTLIGILLLLIACINFTNLTTARSSIRAKEVGVKKVFGIHRRLLISQFLTESILTSFIALFMALVLVWFIFPLFSQITGNTLRLELNFRTLTSGLLITLVTGILAGLYPALYLSKIKPWFALKGNNYFSIRSNGIRAISLRKSLMIFQFVTATVLITSFIIIDKQMKYIHNKELGYDRDHLVHFSLNFEDPLTPQSYKEGEKIDQMLRIHNMIKEIPGVKSSSDYFHNLTGNHGGLSGLDWQEGEEDKKIHFKSLEIGYYFIETMQIEMLMGRSYSREYGKDRSKLIINKEAMSVMGMENPIGKTIKFRGREREIIGVTNNFHFESLYEPIRPCIIQLIPGNEVIVRMDAASQSDVLDKLQKIYASVQPNQPFEYHFLEDDYMQMYTTESQISILSRYFAVLAIIINSLGLLGMVAFMAERKSKEIGIRKVLGASTINVVSLFTNDFSKTVLSSLLIALPISFLFVNYWLQKFAYRIDLTPWPFLFGAFVTILTTWLTITYRTIKMATLNPTDAIRNE
ncbi:MAG: ABC transporter permease [Saprospiraceae bacterium]|nr:ABC transporter permease [Saprospiraceae bacterium]